MRRIVFSGLLLFMLASLLGISGCSPAVTDLDAMEEEDSRMVKALQFKRAQDFDGAIAQYEAILDEKPRTAKAHLQTGLLYDEYKQDYVRAIYHYRRYLELRPEAEKKDLIEDLARHAALSYAASLPDRPSSAIQEIADLKQQISGLEKDLGEAQRRIGELSEALRRHRERAEGTAPAAGTARATDRDVAQDVAAQPVAPGGPEIYKVRSGDTLSKIAQRVYNDGSKWKIIYDANRDTLRNPQDLKLGQPLRIPR